MARIGLLVRLEAKPGKEQEVERFLRDALPLAENETGTSAWFAIKLNHSTFGIFDTFPNEQDRKAHLEGEIAKMLMAKAQDLLAKDLIIEPFDILAATQEK